MANCRGCCNTGAKRHGTTQSRTWQFQEHDAQLLCDKCWREADREATKRQMEHDKARRALEKTCIWSCLLDTEQNRMTVSQQVHGNTLEITERINACNDCRIIGREIGFPMHQLSGCKGFPATPEGLREAMAHCGVVSKASSVRVRFNAWRKKVDVKALEVADAQRTEHVR